VFSGNSDRAKIDQAEATECWREPIFCDCDACSKPPISLKTALNSETVKLQHNNTRLANSTNLTCKSSYCITVTTRNLGCQVTIAIEMLDLLFCDP